VKSTREFAAALLTVMAILAIGAWIQNWWDAKHDR